MKRVARRAGTGPFTTSMLGLLALLGGDGSNANAQPTTFTSPIDVTGAKIQLHLAAPERDSQKVVDIAVPPGLLPKKIATLLATPLSAQMDQYWNTGRSG